MKNLARIALLGSALVLFTSLSAFAGGAAFPQCPAVGADSGCQVLITIGSGGKLSFAVDGTQGPYDGFEDVLVGVWNNSGVTQSSINLTGSGIFGFDGDGLCTYISCGSGADSSGYGGWDNMNNFDSFSVTDANTGSVVFGGGGLAAGGTAFFSLEGNPTSINGVTPEPASLLLMGSGLVGLLLKRRKKA